MGGPRLACQLLLPRVVSSILLYAITVRVLSFEKKSYTKNEISFNTCNRRVQCLPSAISRSWIYFWLLKEISTISLRSVEPAELFKMFGKGEVNYRDIAHRIPSDVTISLLSEMRDDCGECGALKCKKFSADRTIVASDIWGCPRAHASIKNSLRCGGKCHNVPRKDHRWRQMMSRIWAANKWSCHAT